MLTEMLLQSPQFLEFTNEQQDVYLRMAAAFQEDGDAVFCYPEELTDRFSLANRHLWDKFINLEAVKHYISSVMTSRSQVAARRAFPSLEREAATGDVGAIKHINEISGLLEKKDNNKIIILHRIPRPEEKKEEVTK